MIYCSKAFLMVEILLIMIKLSSGVIVFQQPSNFGTMQIQLTTTTGFISTGTSNTFSFANPGYQNITALGLALCGYDIQNPSVLQFRAQASFDNSVNNIVVLILPIGTTKLAFINYYMIIVTQQTAGFLTLQNACLVPPYSPFNSSMFGKTQAYTLASPFRTNSSDKVTGIPFIRSVNNVVADTYNFLQIVSMSSASSSNSFTLTLYNNYSYQSEVCLSVVYYWDTQGLKMNLQNVSYSSNFLLINSSSSTQNLAAVSQLNFTLNNMYGPVFNRKCLVGFQSFKMAASTRQTISFNLTGNGIYGIISSSNYQVNYAWLCMAVITCQGSLSQYYPAINDCQVPCTINNCSICQTSTSCSTCSAGFYLNTLYRCSNCMPYCSNCTNTTVCSQCATGYYYNTSTCIPCAQFCNSCISGACKSCQSGYYANGFQCIYCASVLPKCLLCATGTACSTCPVGYYSSGSSAGCVLCSSVMVGCSACSLAIICSTCQTGYYLNQSKCKPCVATVASCCPFFISNCSLCKNGTTCNLCNIGYFLSSNNQKCTACATTLSNCISCSGPSACLLCNTTFFLNIYNQCVSCSSSISQCSTCANSTYCLYCQPPFLMVNGSCFNCPIWPTNNLYFLDQNNVCQPCQEITSNCIRCNQMICTQCSDLWFLSTNTNTCNLCSDYLNNCLSCNSNASCSICINGYYPDLTSSSICTKCDEKINHCVACSNALDSNKNTYSLVCMGCQRQYYLNSSICSPCIDSINFCLVCSNNFQCVQCQTGYFLGTTMTCISCSQLIIGCTQCQSSSICLSCSGGYYLINNYCTQCQMAINNCFSCGKINVTLTCSACLPGFYLGTGFTCMQCNSTLQFCSTCSSANACTGCISGYTVNYNNTCSPCTYLIPYCQYCSNICIRCIDNYLLDNYGQCNSCNYFIGGCSLCQYIPNNITFTDDLNCTTCLTGYLIYLSGELAKCVACNVTIPNCIRCVNLTFCNTCNNLSFINSKNTCSLCSLYLPNCIFCSDSSTCLMCASSYYINSNQNCEFCDSNQFGNDGSVLKLSLCLSCKYMSGVATCISCIFGYYVAANGCISCAGVIPNCLSCASSNLCIQCQSGYYLAPNNTQCINCPIALAYCQTCDLNGICLQCNSDCYLNSTTNTCIKCYQITSRCNRCTSNAICLACSDGYYMSGQSCMSCQAVLQNCLLCTNSSVCTLNLTTYTVSTTGNSFLTTFTKNIWMYIALGCLGAFALSIVACIVWRKCRPKEEVDERVAEIGGKSHTQRQLAHEEHENNDIKIGHGQLCQYCKAHTFQVMNIELLCKHCEGRKKGNNKDHIIRKEVEKKSIQPKKKQTYKQEKKIEKRLRMEEQSKPKSRKSSDDDKLVISATTNRAGQIDKINEHNILPKMGYTQSQYLQQKGKNISQFLEDDIQNRRKASKSQF